MMRFVAAYQIKYAAESRIYIGAPRPKLRGIDASGDAQ